MRQLISLAARAVALVAIAGAGTAACESDHDEHAHSHDLIEYCMLPASCRAITDACHNKDDVSNAEIHECHETGHMQGTDEACKPVQTSCVAKCNAAPDLDDSGEPEPFVCEGGAPPGGHDAGRD